MEKVSLVKAFCGGGTACNILHQTFSPSLEGSSYPDVQIQGFVDEIARVNGLAKRVLIREIDSKDHGTEKIVSSANFF